ncbi:MAG: DMT family transporter, partial [Anaerolineae bacterium]
MSGELLALLSALLWAVASVLLTIGAKRLHVLPLNMLRCAVSTAFFWALLPFYGGLKALAAIPAGAWIWLVVSVLALLVLGDTLYFRSMDLAGVSWAMPVASINPLVAVVLASLFLDEPLSWSLLGGALLVVAGVTLLSRPAGQTTAGRVIEPAARRAGLLMALVTALLWGIGQVTLKPATEGMHSVVANAVRQPMG